MILHRLIQNPSILQIKCMCIGSIKIRWIRISSNRITSWIHQKYKINIQSQNAIQPIKWIFLVYQACSPLSFNSITISPICSIQFNIQFDPSSNLIFWVNTHKIQEPNDNLFLYWWLWAYLRTGYVSSGYSPSSMRIAHRRQWTDMIFHPTYWRWSVLYIGSLPLKLPRIYTIFKPERMDPIQSMTPSIRLQGAQYRGNNVLSLLQTV